MTGHTLTRREALVATGVAVGGLSVTKRVAATGSGEPELTLNGTIPDGTSIDATIDEYDTEDSSTPINSQTVTADSSGALVFDGLEGQADYHYEGTLEWSGDGDSTPELETPLVFEIPPNWELVNYTTAQDWSSKPDSVEITFDEQRLRKYQPKLKMSDATGKRFDGLYGYVATSPDQDTDVLCYWSKVKRVAEIDWIDDTKLGSGLGDHDPIYVFVDSETGDIQRIVYSTYHLGAAEARPSEDELETSEYSDEPTHPTFTVADRWHHFNYTPDATGHLTELKSWPEVRSTWANNNFGPDAAAVQDPWQLTSTNDWRANDGWFSTTDLWLSLGQTLGWFGADEADDLRED